MSKQIERDETRFRKLGIEHRKLIATCRYKWVDLFKGRNEIPPVKDVVKLIFSF